MTEMTASLIKELRDKTGAGMMDCKKTLTEANGDMDAAVDLLRKKGLATAAKKSGRAAAQGLVSVSAEGNYGVVIELNAETDFVSRNDQFQKFLTDITELALKNKIDSIEALKAADLGGKTVEETLTNLIATIGENMNLRRLQTLSVKEGIIASYVHNTIVSGCGKIGVLVALESSGKQDVLVATGKQLAMHVAAVRAEALDVNSLCPDLVARERALHADKAKESGKPAEIVEKMIEGSMRKYYEKVVLNEQTLFDDGKTKITSVLQDAGKEAGAPVKISGYIRYELGEGVEVDSNGDDFADEVAKMAAGG